jgi:hypothetical protein
MPRVLSRVPPFCVAQIFPSIAIFEPWRLQLPRTFPIGGVAEFEIPEKSNTEDGRNGGLLVKS